MLGVRKRMEAWNDVIRRFHNILEKCARASKRVKFIAKGLETIAPQIKPSPNLATSLVADTKVVKADQRIERIIFRTEPFLKMLEVFTRDMPNESVVWLSGRVRNGIGIVEKCWLCELKYSSRSEADTKKSWFVNFIEKLQTTHPEHNLIILAHTHQIGPVLGETDKETLKGLDDWNSHIYWAMIACDMQIGCYEAKKLAKVLWRVEESEGKETDS